MKKHVFIFGGLLLMSFAAFCQNTVNLIIFSEDGDPFFAYINGVKQNNTAETNVKFTGLTPNISLRIEFQDKALPQLKQTMALETGFEHTARIKRDMKKQLKLRYFGSVPLNEAATGMNTVAYHTADDQGSYNTSSQPEPAVNQNSSSTTINSTSQSNSTNTNGGNVSVNINVPGVGINMNVSGMDPNINSTTSTTVTNSSSSSTTYSGSDNTQNTQYQDNSNNTVQTCKYAMSAGSFTKMKESIEAKPFSDTKMSTAKVATKNNCLSVNQVKEIAKLFSMDEDKLTYAKFAYNYCIDKANYYQVGDVFSFSTTTDELNEFLSK